MGYKVEFLGLCGAGKTTFLNELSSEIKSDKYLGIEYPVIPSLWQTLLSLIKILFIGFFFSPVSFSRFLSKKNNWWLVKKIALRSAGIKLRGDSNFILVDSGILQPFLSFEIEENVIDSNIPIHAILAGCNLPNLLLNFVVDPKIAMERYEKRGLRGDGKLIRANSKTNFNKAEKLRKNLISYCKMNKVEIIEVDSTQNFSQEFIKSKLMEINKYIKKEDKNE